MRYRFSLLIMGLALIGFSGCQWKNVVLIPPRNPEPAPIRDRYAILINMDGSRPEEVTAGVEAGRLPQFKKLFYENGARFENAITVFPTVSSPAHQSFLSGLFPGHHGIPALDWFSRPLLVHYDYLLPKHIPYTNSLLFNYLQLLEGRVHSDAPQMIYGTLAGHPTMSVFEPANHGATYVIPSKPPLKVALRTHFGKSYEQIDFTAVKETLTKFRDLPMERLPRFTMVSLFGMDLATHYDGPTSPRAEDLYVYYDRFLRDLQKVLETRGIWNRTTVVVVSDHGQHRLAGVVDLPQMLHEMGFKLDPQQPKNSQVVWGDHGTGISNLYFRMGDDWERPPSFEEIRNYPLAKGRSVDLVQAFLRHPDMEALVLPEGPLKTHLFWKDGHVLIQRKWTGEGFLYAYLPDPGTDPLGYTQNPVVAQWVKQGSFQDSEAWLRQTHDFPMPDAVVSVPQIFDDHRAGDMMLISVKDKQFKEEKLFGHGSLYAEDRRITMLWHGPDIQAGVYPCLRSVDVYPTLLAIFGLKSHSPMDGILRKEIFTKEFSQNLHENHEAIQGEIKTLKADPGRLQDFYALNPRELKKVLKEKLIKGNLSKEEENKARQLLFTLEQFFKMQLKNQEAL